MKQKLLLSLMMVLLASINVGAQQKLKFNVACFELDPFDTTLQNKLYENLDRSGFRYAMMLNSIIPTIMCASSIGNYDKQITKEAKKTIKDLKKEGWNVYGSSISLEKAIISYYQKLEESDGDLRSIITETEGSSEHTAIKKAQHRANAQYAELKGTDIKRDVNIKVSNENSSESSSEFDQTVQTKVEQRVKLLRPELILTRKKADGKVEVKAMFLIEENDD